MVNVVMPLTPLLTNTLEPPITAYDAVVTDDPRLAGSTSNDTDIELVDPVFKSDLVTPLINPSAKKVVLVPGVGLPHIPLVKLILGPNAATLPTISSGVLVKFKFSVIVAEYDK